MIHETNFSHPLLERNFTFLISKAFFFLFLPVLILFSPMAQSAARALSTQEWEEQNRLNQITIRREISALRESLQELDNQKRMLKAPLDAHVRRSTTLERLHSSYAPMLYTLHPEVNYVDPRDPLFHIKSSSSSPLPAEDFVEHGCFKFFRRQLEKDINALIRLVLKGIYRRTLEISFDVVRTNFRDLYIVGTLGASVEQIPFSSLPEAFVLEDDLKTSIKDHLHTARQSLQSLIADSAVLFEQYREPEGSSPKKNALLRDGLARRLGLTRSTLHKVAEQKVEWKSWLEAKVLRPLIHAGTEAWFQAILAEEKAIFSRHSPQQIRVLATLHQLSELKKQRAKLYADLRLKRAYLQDLIDQFPPIPASQHIFLPQVVAQFSPERDTPDSWEELEEEKEIE